MFTAVSIKHNIIANFLGKIWSGLMSFIFVPFYIRFLGIEAYGLIGFFISMMALFTVLDMGLSTTLNRELARLAMRNDSAKDARDLVRTLEYIYWGTGVLVAVVIIALAPWIARYWINLKNISVETVTQAIILQGVVAGLRWTVPLYSGGLLGMQRQVLLNTLNAGMATLQGAGAVLVLWLIASTIQAYFIWQIIVAVLQSILFPICLWRLIPARHHRPTFSRHWLTTVWRFAAGMTGITITSLILMQLDKILLSKFLPLDIFGYYTLAVSIAGVFSLAANSIFPALFPAFSQLWTSDKVEALATLYHKSCQLLSIVLFPIGIVVMLFSKELLSCYLMNPVIVNNTYKLLSLIFVGTMLNSIMVLPLALQLGYGWTKLSFYKNMIAVAIAVPLLIVMVTRYGAIGAAVVWILLNTGYVLIEVPIMHSRLLIGEKWKWYIMDIGCPLCISLLVVGLARFFLPPGGLPFLKLPWLVSAAFFAMALSASILPASREWMRKAIYGRILPIL